MVSPASGHGNRRTTKGNYMNLITFNEWCVKKGLLIEFDPNRGGEGRSIPQALHRGATSDEQGFKIKGKRDDKCNQIKDPYQKFKCNLVIRAKGSVARFGQLISDRRPWDGKYWTEEEMQDLKKAYDAASWKHDSKQSLRNNKGVPQNPTDQLAKNLHQQDIDLYGTPWNK
jgi:hypothetical protein